MMLLIGMLRVLFREGQRNDREEEHFPLVSVRFAASSQSRAEELRRRQKTHASRGKEREKKIKNKAHSQHEFHEESDEPKHDETCVKRESKGERRKEQSAQHRRKEKPLASMTRTTTTTSGKKKKKKKKKFESSDRSFVGGAVYI